MIQKLAAIYDVHGNTVALDAVLKEIHISDVDAIVVGGDLAWVESIRMNTPEVEVMQMIQDVTQPMIVCGHTHVQYDRAVDNKRILNPGSVGLPSQAKGACWAIIGE